MVSDKTRTLTGAGAGAAVVAGGAVAWAAWREHKLRELVDGKSVHFEKFDPRRISADPEAFQFKSNGDAAGVTERLRGVTKWDPVAAGKAVIFERADGTRVIADGHQRLGLAKRLAGAGENVRMDGYLFRERDGWTPKDVRAYAALKNIKELSGAALDMAKVIRERPDLIDGSVPLSDMKIKQAMSLSKLSPKAFNMVTGGVIRPELAAAIGEQVKDASRHAGMIGELVKSEVSTIQQARLYVGQAMAAPSIAEETASLFGKEVETRSLVRERATVLDKSLALLKSDRKVFATLDLEANRIEGAGNKLARATNAARAEAAGQLNALVEKLATKAGPVSTMLDDAARSVAGGENSKAVARKFVEALTEKAKGAGGLQALLSDAPKPPIAASATPKGQSSFLAEPTTADKVAAESRAIAAKGRIGDPMNDGLFSSSSKQTDLVDTVKAAEGAPASRAPAPTTPDVSARLKGLKKPQLKAVAEELGGSRLSSRMTNAQLRSAIEKTVTVASRQAQRGEQISGIFGNTVDDAAVNRAGTEARSQATSNVHAAIDKVTGKGPSGWSDAAREASATVRAEAAVDKAYKAHLAAVRDTTSDPKTKATNVANTREALQQAQHDKRTAARSVSKPARPAKVSANVSELAAKVGATLDEKVSVAPLHGKPETMAPTEAKIARIKQVMGEIKSAKLSRADKIALAHAVGNTHIPASATGVRALESVTHRLRSVSDVLHKMMASGGRSAAAITIAMPAAAALVAYDATKSQAMAAGKDEDAATGDALASAAVAGGGVAVVGAGISKGIQLAAKAAPTLAQAVGKAFVPGTLVYAAATEGRKGYEHGGITGAGVETGLATLDMISAGLVPLANKKLREHLLPQKGMAPPKAPSSGIGRAYLNMAAAKKAQTTSRAPQQGSTTAPTTAGNGWVAGYTRADGVRVDGYRRK